MLTPAVLVGQPSVSTSGDIQAQGKLISTQPSGPPLEVASTDLVANFNADRLDGLDAVSFALGADLSALSDLVAALQTTIDQQEDLIAKLHPKLVLHNSRFRVWVTFSDGATSSPAEAVPVGSGDDAGYFYFTRDFYVDVFLKVLDAVAVSGQWWVFFAPLTDLEFTLTVLDTETGARQNYFRAAGSRASVVDTGAFSDTGGYPIVLKPDPERSVVPVQSAGGIGGCIPSMTTLCLIDGRFSIEVTWEDFSTNTGDGSVSGDLQTSHSGVFYLFDPASLDLVVKIVETPGLFEVNIGSLTNLQYTVTVSDTCTFATQTYVSPLGSLDNFVDAVSFPKVPCP